MQKGNRLVYGVFVNDADYVVKKTVNKRIVECQFYRTWRAILTRCYSAKFQSNNKTYSGCTVSKDWHRFMSFREWMKDQDWSGKQIDKDLLFPGNKIYSPETCVFVSQATNLFTIDRSADRGEFPIGVSWNKKNKNFRSDCRNPFTDKKEFLGSFDCPEAAHEAWRKRKHELALQLAAQQADPRLAKALSIRYLKEQSCI